MSENATVMLRIRRSVFNGTVVNSSFKVCSSVLSKFERALKSAKLLMMKSNPDKPPCRGRTPCAATAGSGGRGPG